MIMCKTKVITKNKKADVCTLSLMLEDTDSRRDDGKTADACTLSLWLEDTGSGGDDTKPAGVCTEFMVRRHGDGRKKVGGQTHLTCAKRSIIKVRNTWKPVCKQASGTTDLSTLTDR